MRILLFLLVLSLVETLAQDKFYFSVSPEDVSAPAGSPVTLRCAVSEAEGVSYSWHLNGRPLHESPRRYAATVPSRVGGGGGVETQLRITRLELRDAGEAACIATNTTSGFSLTSRAATVDVQWVSASAEVRLQSPDSPAHVSNGSSVVLRCVVDGSGEIRVDWFRNGERLAQPNAGSGARLLHLNDVSPRNNGVYRCAASGAAGTAPSASGGGFALAVPGARWPLIEVLPSDLVVRRGGTARFNCRYRDADVTEWYFKDTGPLGNSSRYSVASNGSLAVHSVAPEDEGLYACVGIRGESAEVPQKYTAQLSLAYLEDLSRTSFEPELLQTLRHVVPEKTDFQIICKRPRGLPPPKTWWLDPRRNVMSDPDPVRADEARLTLKSVRFPEDSGNYSCVSENVAGVTSQSFELVVSIPPTVISHPVTVTVEEEGLASLSCRYKGMPHPISTVRWNKDGRPVRADGVRVHVNAKNGTLTVRSVQLSDRGEYICLVNTTGFKPVQSKSAHIYVTEKLKFTPQPVNKKMELGTVSKINCKAQGSTPPTIHWFKEGEGLLDRLPHITIINGTLIFNVVKASDKGRYTCVANNPQGLINASIDIEVHVSPKFTVLPKNPSEVIEGYPLRIDCAAEGDPKPTIQWDKNSAMNAFDHRRFHVLENGSLLIQEAHLSDEGKYGCTAGNSGGFKREEVSLYVRSAEGYSPDNPEAGNQTGNSMITKTVVITLSAAAAYMLLVVGLMLWCRYRRRKRKQSYLAQETAEGTSALLEKADNAETAYTANGDTELRDSNKSKLNGVTAANGHPRSDGENTAQSQSSNHSKKSKSSGCDSLSFPRGDLLNMMLLGSGDMGEVYLAQAKGTTTPGADTSSNLGVVMVKALNHTRDETALLEFRRQLDMFQRANHPNVVSLIGLCREQDPHYMLLQYTDWGDLKQFLLATREKTSRKSPQSPQPPQPPKPSPLTLAQIISLANQAALGMEHLSNLRIVHKDVAARNCLISSKMGLKISLSGLSKDTYSREYFEHRNQVMPLRWLPHEAVLEDDYSSKSDVYSYGALVWEILSQAELPFHRKTDEDVLAALKNQELQWKIPKNCTPSLSALLGRCWAESPRDRPTFSQIVSAVSEMEVDSEM